MTGPDSSLVTVVRRDAYTGDLYLTRDLDHEQRAELSLLLTLTDGHLGQDNFITQPLLILVEDSNDNSPVFVSLPGPVRVVEHQLPGDKDGAIAQFVAEDEDSGAFGQVVYGLAGGQAEDIYQHFSVSTDRDGGHLHLKTELDYEAGRLYQVVVEARDRASLGQANRARATLIVEVSERRSDTWRGLRTVCRWWTLLTRPRSGSPCRPSPGYRRTSRSSLRWVATALAPAPVNFITSMYV